ncbi:MAG: ABC transporter ATP-binding protein [Chthoniobacterales bacterium]
MAKVLLQNLCKIVPGKEGAEVKAVSDFNLEIADGEFVVFAGPPGSGKSSILRMIAGLEKPSRGDILIGDHRVNDLLPRDRDVAMLFRNDVLYPAMSVYDNIGFGLKLRKFSTTEIGKRVKDAAAILGIEQSLAHRPDRLSGPERVRVALGRAIVRQPKVFLFDEPLANLDANLRGQLRTEIRKLHQRLEATMIYATHDQAEALMGDGVLILNNGVTQQKDSPVAVYNAPANLFVAGFLGRPSMNIVQGRLKQERDSLLFCESGGGTIEARLAAAEHPAAREFLEKPVLLGIRPEDIEVADVARGEESRGTFPALVDLVEPAGAETFLYVETGAHTLVCRSRRDLKDREAGHRMRFEINLKKTHLFDPVSGRRITAEP